MTMRKAQIAVVDAALTLFGLALLGLGLWAAWSENLGLAGTTLGGGLVLLFAATIDRFESVKGLGMEATTKKLRASIDQAEGLTAQLDELVEFVGTNLIVLTSATGRWASTPSVMEAYMQAMHVKRMLERAKVDPAKIRKALIPWAKTVAFDAAGSVKHEVHTEVRKNYDELRQRLISHDPDANGLRQRIEAVEAYLSKQVQGAEKWTLGEIIEEIGRLLEDAPEIPDSKRRELRGRVATLQGELRFVDEHMDFKDQEFWARFKRAHELAEKD